MRLPEGQRSTAWVQRLPEVVAALNNEVTSLTGKKPAVAIKEKSVYSKPSTPYLRPVGKKRKNSSTSCPSPLPLPTRRVRRRRQKSHRPNLVFQSLRHRKIFYERNQPVVYYLRDGPKRGFVREELLVVPPNSELPPEKL